MISKGPFISIDTVRYVLYGIKSIYTPSQECRCLATDASPPTSLRFLATHCENIYIYSSKKNVTRMYMLEKRIFFFLHRRSNIKTKPLLTSVITLEC